MVPAHIFKKEGSTFDMLNSWSQSNLDFYYYPVNLGPIKR